MLRGDAPVQANTRNARSAQQPTHRGALYRGDDPAMVLREPRPTIRDAFTYGSQAVPHRKVDSIACSLTVVAAALLVSANALADPIAPLVREAPAPKSILFVGNSFTYFNNSLHMHVRELTHSVFKQRKKKNKKIYAKAMTISGAYLPDHVLGAKGMITEFKNERKPGPWDVVVVQGYSRGPIEEETAAAFRHSARTLDRWIRASGSTTVLFMTWAYEHKPEMTAPLAAEYTRLGNEIGALVVPVGLAFERARAEDPTMDLYDPDKIHPSPLGTYLAANVFFAALYRESPMGAEYDAGLSAAEAAFAQKIAWTTIKGFYAD